MSSSLPDPGWPPRSDWLDSDEEATPPAAGNTAGMFDEILEETSRALVSLEPLTAAENQAVREVVGRHRGQPLSLEPVATDLIHALLQGRFQGVENFARFGQLLSWRVAQTLMDDPVASERLGALWGRLSGGE
jgi:hypothetical protein